MSAPLSPPPLSPLPLCCRTCQDFARAREVSDPHDPDHVTAALAYILQHAVPLPSAPPVDDGLSGATTGCHRPSVAASWHRALSALSVYVQNVLMHPEVRGSARIS
jgi:hypothetical protein